MTVNITPATEQDLEVIKTQLGRVPRGVAGIAARCCCGNPMVVATAPRLDDGTPFPTCFYLSYPALVKAVSTMEAAQVMELWQNEMQEDEELLTRYQKAHEAYIEARRSIGEAAGIAEVPEIDGISAGGMPNRIKCLHALVGHALAAGPGINPIGDRVLQHLKSTGKWHPDFCYC